MRGADVERLQHLLLGFGGDGAQARGNEIGEPAGIGDVGRQRLQVVRHQRRQRHNLLEVGLDVPLQRVDLEVVFVLQDLRCFGRLAAQVRTRRRDLVEAHARQALHDDSQAAVRQLEHLVNLAGGTDFVQVALPRFVFARFALREDGNGLSAGDRFVNQLDGAFTRHGERHEGLRKQHRVAQRQHRHFRRHAKHGGIRSRGIEWIDVIAHGVAPPGGEGRKVSRRRGPQRGSRVGVAWRSLRF